MRHPDYDENYYDVALLHLESPLSLSDRVQPICLPCESQPDPASLVRHSITSQGWGTDNAGEVGGALTQIDVTVRSKAECDYKYNNTKSVQSRLSSCQTWCPPHSSVPTIISTRELEPALETVGDPVLSGIESYPLPTLSDPAKKENFLLALRG